MRAKPSSSLEPLAFFIAVFVTGCRDNSPEMTSFDAQGSAPPPLPSVAVPSSRSFVSLIGDPAHRALDAHAQLVKHLQTGAVLPDDPRYLVFRRALAAGAPLWRRREMLAGEVIFGPLKSVDEAGGALARLDAALVQADARIAQECLDTVAAPLRLFVETSKTLTFTPLVLGQTLSAAAYDLGLIALEAAPAIPDGLPAVLADAEGILDFIERGTAVLADMAPEKSTAIWFDVQKNKSDLRKRLDDAVLLHKFDDRAAFVVLTGKLGAALRRLAASVALEPRPPYRPRRMTGKNEIDENLSAFTIPARNFANDDPETIAYVNLGRELFFDKRLSKRGLRACATCHAPEKGLADGTARPKSLDPSVTLRHTPSLLYGTIQAAYLWDGRVVTAERQALGVIHARAEMGLSDEDIVHALEGAADLRPLVDALSTTKATSKLTPDVVARALVAFQAREFVSADAPIDRYARGEESALSAAARAGLDVFAGRGRCARCHVPPLFGGSRPRDFSVPVFAVLGVPTSPDVAKLDTDLGRGAVTHREIDAHAFKTPTARNLVRTAPYFHHGTFRTLEQVVDFYDRGGGRGLGLSVPNQDPDVRKLGLSAGEKAALLEFLRVALLDATPPEKLIGKRIGGR